ncbi:MAG TPA: Stp1/IreP family PP2C-type Ser/Thr phosphatase [Terracidiphilus sp.]|nr:Stp1/IreP family PP2C-type Ser/Thr phosphatase [Terracidiphilus sp.]
MGTALVHYTAAAASDTGRKRPSNQDAAGYSIEHGIYVLCDGMGGAAAGEVASSTAVTHIMDRLTHRDPDTPLLEAAEAAIQAANLAVFTRAAGARRLRGMGTTMVALVVDEHAAWVLNIGDSRCYLLRGRHLQQVSRDHSLVEEEVRMGRMSPAEALHSPYRNVITRALGTHKLVAPDIFEVETEPGDLFLLCSDGLTREIDDSLIEGILRLELPLSELCDRLIDAANKAGGNDNITCLLARAA